jgi:hypothetical protein
MEKSPNPPSDLDLLPNLAPEISKQSVRKGIKQCFLMQQFQLSNDAITIVVADLEAEKWQWKTLRLIQLWTSTYIFARGVHYALHSS